MPLARPAAALVLVALLLPGRARAFGASSQLTFALIRYDGNYDPRPNGLERIAWEVEKRTSINVSLQSKIIDLTDPDLFQYPLLVLAGDSDFPPFSEAQREALRRHLAFGGLLLIDDASGEPDGPFEQAARREMAAVLPNARIVRIPKSHVLYKSFYLLDGPSGRVATAGDADGIFLQGRLAVIFSPDDLEGATARDAFGNWEMDVTPGGDLQREYAYRFAINIVMYALCLDYKDDQVHIPFIMRRRQQ